MKKILFLVLAIILLCGFRAPNGEIIVKGDYVDKLIIHMGKPHMKINMGSIYNGVGGFILQREMWVYRIDDYNYRFTIINGQIVHDHWSRF